MSEMNFEKAFTQLQEVVKKLESGSLTLEDSLQAFEEGVKYTRFCQESLTQAEQKVEQLLKVSADGKTTTKPFQP
jgi:exodeoxyribonuclease VII small subunit